MIQLPSTIRTTLFNASVEKEPNQLFAHELDRLLVLIYITDTNITYPAFGRSKQDVENSDALSSAVPAHIMFYGPEPLWVGYSKRSDQTFTGFILVHGIYRA